MNLNNFTYKVKEEIYININKLDDLKNFIYGFLMNLELDEEIYSFYTDNYLFIKILKKYFKDMEIIKSKNKYELLFRRNEELIEIDKNIKEKERYELEQILTGIFLNSGSIKDPVKGYFLEIRNNINNKDKVNYILKKLGIKFNSLIHNNKYVVYIKRNEIISDILKIFRVNEQLFYFEENKIMKDFNMSIQRINNLDVSNINKQIKSSQEIIKIINFLSNTNKFNNIDINILEYCETRKEYPDYSMKQLTEIVSKKLNKNITKSWINHVNIKLRKLYNKFK